MKYNEFFDQYTCIETDYELDINLMCTNNPYLTMQHDSNCKYQIHNLTYYNSNHFFH